MSDIKNPELKKQGKLKIEWSSHWMPVLKVIQKRFAKENPLSGIKIGACLHITTETANLAIALKAGGAEVSLCASNPLSTKDDVAASLVEDYHVPVYAIEGEDRKTYYKHINDVLDIKPNVTLDDGADLVSTIHSTRRELIQNILGGTEETTTGVIRLRALEKEKNLEYPIVAVNDSETKYLFDNRYGTGQSTIDGILRATNILLAGKTVVICGYGWCGRGVAMRAKGMGGNVVVCETNPIRALEALMDGYRVMRIKDASPIGDLFVTVTGDINVMRKSHFESMKDGAILANSGHFDVEINKVDLKKLSIKRRMIRESVEEFEFKNGKRLYLLSEGRLVNLSAAEGHPASVMDMSFANQAFAVEYIVKNGRKMEKKVYKIPEETDKEIANLKLISMGVKIDILTEQQKKYLSSWQIGT